MCSSGDHTVSSTEQAQAAFTNTLNADFQIAFAKSQAILDQLNAKLTNMIQNPQGFSKEAETALRTQATTENTAEFKNAAQNANTYIATHGGDALPSGVAAQINAQVAQGAASQEAGSQNAITMTNEQLKLDNYWKAISGLGGVAQEENPTGLANAEIGAANSVANLGDVYLRSKQAGWQNLGGVLSGIAGLGSAAVGGWAVSKGLMPGSGAH